MKQQLTWQDSPSRTNFILPYSINARTVAQIVCIYICDSTALCHMSLLLCRSLANPWANILFAFSRNIYIHFLTDLGNFTCKFTPPFSCLHPSTPFFCSCLITASFSPLIELPFICLPSQVDGKSMADPCPAIMGSLGQDLPHLWPLHLAFGLKPFHPAPA